MLRRFHILLSLVFLTGCAAQPTEHQASFDPRHDSLFENYGNIESTEAIHELTESQQQLFLSFFNNPNLAHIAPHKRLYDYLDRITGNFHYQEQTFNASETLALSRGDCMSLAVLTTALAELAGVPIKYQLVDADPVFALSPNLAVRGVHVRSYLIDPDWRAVPNQLMLRQPGLLVDYFPSGKERFIENLSHGEYAARYYLNLATQHLQQGELSKSYWLVVTALEQDQTNADALNTLAVIYRRYGSYEDAERVYQYAINHLPNKLVTLRNYQLMLTSLGRDSEAEALGAQLRELDDPSPFSWYRGARDAFAAGDYPEAEYYYKKAIEKAPYIPELRYGLAQALVKQGQLQTARAEIEKSLENVWGSANRLPYKAKLKWLQKQAEAH
jgi:Tfp pilus assembly protein PilF